MEQIKISEKYSKYVENKKQVEHILNQCEYDLIYMGLNEKEQQYKYILKINDLCFNYFEGIGNARLNSENKQDKMLNSIWCLLNDRQCVINYATEYNFLVEFGYNENAKALENGQKIYNNIKENNKKLLKAFNREQLDYLTDNIQL